MHCNEIRKCEFHQNISPTSYLTIPKTRHLLCKQFYLTVNLTETALKSFWNEMSVSLSATALSNKNYSTNNNLAIFKAIKIVTCDGEYILPCASTQASPFDARTILNGTTFLKQLSVLRSQKNRLFVCTKIIYKYNEETVQINEESVQKMSIQKSKKKINSHIFLYFCIIETSPNETLCSVQCILWVRDCLPFCRCSNQPFTFLCKCYHWRRCPHALCILNYLKKHDAVKKHIADTSTADTGVCNYFQQAFAFWAQICLNVNPSAKRYVQPENTATDLAQKFF